MSKISTTILVIIVLLAVAGFFVKREFFTNIVPSEELPGLSDNVLEEETEKETESELTVIPDREVVAENLTIPWDVAFLPDGNLLVTERAGRLIEFDTKSGTSKVIEISGVKHSGEGGLLGLVLHPNFQSNSFLYLYLTSSLEGESSNRVLRFKYSDGELSDERIIVDDIPGALFHNGGRIAFGPDDFLYIATGDGTNPESAQDIDSLAGKILRLNDEGEIPSDNPSENEVYSYGHRNPQGLTWDREGRLWSTEHGRSGVRSGLDELNLIVKGGNYGWPESQGDTVLPQTIGPAAHSGPDVTWAPGSALYWDGSIFFGGLRGQTLYEAVLDGDEVMEIREHFKNEFGRIRTVTLGPDEMIYLTTSNRDGRGNVREGDDKIIRLNLSQFRQ